MEEKKAELKEVRFVGSSHRELLACPDAIQKQVGYGLYFAQQGERYLHTKPLKGFGGASVIEIIADSREGTFRSVYTVQFEDIVYVLHVFQKKSKSGKRTDRADILKIHARLKEAEEAYADYLEENTDQS